MISDNGNNLQTLIIYGAIGLVIFLVAIGLFYFISKKYEAIKRESQEGSNTQNYYLAPYNQDQNNSVAIDVVDPLPLYSPPSRSNQQPVTMSTNNESLSQPPAYKKFNQSSQI